MISYPFEVLSSKKVKKLLCNNKVISFPTETFYGLGGNAFSSFVVNEIYQLKERSKEKSLLVLITPEWLTFLCKFKDRRINDLIRKFWPGPLTLVLKINPKIPKHLHNNDSTIAVRYSSSPVVNKLIQLCNCPIIGTSANLSGKPACNTAAQVLEQFNKKLDLIIDGGLLPSKLPSTVLDCSKKKFKILREGSIESQELKQICDLS